MRRQNNINIHIYKIVNSETGKVYIGQTYRSVHTRFMEHMIDPESGVYQDVCKYGRSAFSYEVLRDCLSQYSDQWEHYYICKYDSTNPDFGYNKVSGVSYRWVTGGNNPSKTVAGKERISKYNAEHIDQITKGFRAYNESCKFPVGMLDDSGTIIMKFDCLNAACKYLGKPSCGTTRIKQICDKFRKNGKRCKFYGYAWTALDKNVQTNPVVGCRAEDEYRSNSAT